MTGLIAAGVVAVAGGLISFTLGPSGPVQEPAATAMPAKVAEPALVTGTIAARPISASTLPPAAAGTSNPICRNPDALGVTRVVEIDTTGGPGFGFEHFKRHDFLRDKEVVLTFDDGPWPTTNAVVKALADECVRATFFAIGKHATYYPEVLRGVAAGGHSVGSHTWWCRRDLCWNWVTRSPAFREYRVRRRGQLADRWMSWQASANRQPFAC
jgi:hypothetical protein